MSQGQVRATCTSLSGQVEAGTVPVAHLCDTSTKAFVPKVAEKRPVAHLPTARGAGPSYGAACHAQRRNLGERGASLFPLTYQSLQALVFCLVLSTSKYLVLVPPC